MHLHGPLFLALISRFCLAAPNAEAATNYVELRTGFESPNHAEWGEVPLWWWEGQPVTKERITAQLEVLSAKGVKAVCPIQRSPGRCDPQSFTEEYWQLLAYATRECARLGMRFWAYDQVGYGHYGWLEKAAAHVQDPRTHRVAFLTKDVAGGAAAQIALPEGQLIAARAYPLVKGVAVSPQWSDPLIGSVVLATGYGVSARRDRLVSKNIPAQRCARRCLSLGRSYFASENGEWVAGANVAKPM